MAHRIPEFKGTLASGISSAASAKSVVKSEYFGHVGKKENGCASQRHEEGERKRLESLKRQREAYSERKKIISAALKAVDRSTPHAPINKKIKFSSSSSSSDQEDEVIPAASCNVQSMSSKKHPKPLFDDDDDAADVSVDFGSTKFKGEVGSKLLELQAKYGSVDKRFQLDERFLDNETEDGPASEVPLVPAEVSALKEECKSNLRVLEKVLGKPLVKEAPVWQSTETPYLRYDPEDPAHRRFQVTTEPEVEAEMDAGEIDQASVSSSSSDQRGKDSPTEAGEPSVAVGLDPDFADHLRQKQIHKTSSNLEPASGFSLRKLFGREESVHEKDATSTDATHSLNAPSWQLSLMRGQQSSEDEAEDASGNVQDTSIRPKAETTSRSLGGERRLFFLHDDKDSRISEGDKFRRTDAIEAIRAKWEKQRYGLINFYKSRRKEALKKRKRRAAKVKPESKIRVTTMKTMLIPRVLINARNKSKMQNHQR